MEKNNLKFANSKIALDSNVCWGNNVTKDCRDEISININVTEEVKKQICDCVYNHMGTAWYLLGCAYRNWWLMEQLQYLGHDVEGEILDILLKNDIVTIDEHGEAIDVDGNIILYCVCYEFKDSNGYNYNVDYENDTDSMTLICECNIEVL